MSKVRLLIEKQQKHNENKIINEQSRRRRGVGTASGARLRKQADIDYWARKAEAEIEAVAAAEEARKLASAEKMAKATSDFENKVLVSQPGEKWKGHPSITTGGKTKHSYPWSPGDTIYRSPDGTMIYVEKPDGSHISHKSIDFQRKLTSAKRASEIARKTAPSPQAAAEADFFTRSAEIESGTLAVDPKGAPDPYGRVVGGHSKETNRVMAIEARSKDISNLSRACQQEITLIEQGGPEAFLRREGLEDDWISAQKKMNPKPAMTGVETKAPLPLTVKEKNAVKIAGQLKDFESWIIDSQANASDMWVRLQERWKKQLTKGAARPGSILTTEIVKEFMENEQIIARQAPRMQEFLRFARRAGVNLAGKGWSFAKVIVKYSVIGGILLATWLLTSCRESVAEFRSDLSIEEQEQLALGLAFALAFDPDPSGSLSETLMKVMLIGPSWAIAANISQEKDELEAGGQIMNHIDTMVGQMEYKYNQVRDIERQDYGKDYHQLADERLHGKGPTGYERFMGLVFGKGNPDVEAGWKWARDEASRKSKSLHEHNHNKLKFKIIIKE